MTRFSLARRALIVGALGVTLLAGHALAQTVPSIHIVAIDADPASNTATSLGPLNACVRSEPGQQILVDLIVDAVPGPPDLNGIISFEVSIDYPPDIVEVSDVDYEFLLGARGQFQPFEGLSDARPDQDGRFKLAIVDLAVNAPTQGANVEDGPGVLARITLTAKAQGLATVVPAVDPSEADPDVYDAYPAIFSNQNKPFQVDTIGGALVAVGQDCPVPPNSTPAVQEVPRLDESLVAGGATPTATPDGSATEATPSPTTGATGPKGGTPTQEPDAPDDVDGENFKESGGDDGGIGAGTVALVAALAVGGAGMAAAGGRVLMSRRARRAAGSE